ncbi:Lin0512 family protein [Marimonas arenosa]|uniref:Lin0512 family protein n=1 Tax=Marimonas arenosa TaxID=1795305 RepID=A0AAE3WD08_9RHOB|nr:Lin0512 family protein [Marimonas arenosa]MDQ2090701.1 Lin0512 family protein [Marimonas arenosa]
MTDQRFIIEMGMGTDLHGRDYTKAARRAVENALRRSSLHILGLPGLDRAALRVKVTIGVQAPDRVDVDAICACLPHGSPEVMITRGGLDVTHPETGDTAAIASAAIEAFLPPQSGMVPPPS